MGRRRIREVVVPHSKVGERKGYRLDKYGFTPFTPPELKQQCLTIVRILREEGEQTISDLQRRFSVDRNRMLLMLSVITPSFPVYEDDAGKVVGIYAKGGPDV